MANPAPKHLRVSDRDGIAVVDFVDSGLMFESALVEEIGEELKSLVSTRGVTKLLLNFGDVQYVSSTMLAQLARLAKEVQKVGGQLKLCGLGPILKDTFRIGHFDSLFAMYDDPESAMKAFR